MRARLARGRLTRGFRRLEDLCLVKQGSMKTQHTLVGRERRVRHCRRWRRCSVDEGRREGGRAAGVGRICVCALRVRGCGAGDGQLQLLGGHRAPMMDKG